MNFSVICRSFYALTLAIALIAPLHSIAQDKVAVAASARRKIGLELETALVVSTVAPGSPAQKAGFQLGDFVFKPDGEGFGTLTEFLRYVRAQPPNAPFPVKILRAGKTSALIPTLDQFDASSTVPKEQRGRLGLGVSNSVRVLTILAGSVGEKGGLKPGDEISRINGAATPTAYEANAALLNLPADTEAAVAFRREGKNYISTLYMGNALAPHIELLSAADVYLDIKQNGQTAVDEYLGKKLLVEGRVLTISQTDKSTSFALDTPYNSADLDDANKKYSPVLVSVPKQLGAGIKVGELFRFRGELVDPEIGKKPALVVFFVSTERVPVAANDPSHLPEKTGSARYDRSASRYFTPLSQVYAHMVSRFEDAAELQDKTDFFSGKVGAIFLDKPKAGQAAVVLETGVETPQKGERVPLIVLIYPDKVLAQFCKQGETHYFEGTVRRMTPQDETPGAFKPATMFLEGVFPFPSPGAAFSPARPLLRSSVKTPAGTVSLADMVKEAATNSGTVRETYLNKPKTFQGYVEKLQPKGKDFVITFQTQETAGRETATIKVTVSESYGKALRGFKRSYLLRFDGSLISVTPIKKQRAKAGMPNASEDYTENQLEFQATRLYLRETPL